MPPPHYLRHVFRAGLAVQGQPVLLAPRHERLDFDVHLFDFLSLALDHPHSIKSTLFPLFVRVIELVTVFNDFGQPLPLLSVKPSEANDGSAIRRVLRHGRACRGLTFPVTGARAPDGAKHSASARVRVDWAVRQQDHSLKEVIAVGAIELAGEHATMLETGGQSRRGKGHCDRASREALCPRSQRDTRV
jgi:hypothetical protein